jgi:hypothetical protein
MSNQTLTNETQSNPDQLSHQVLEIVSYIPLFIITCGLTGNLTAFLIFAFERRMKSLSSMRILCFISIVDTLALFVWNLNHYLRPNFNITLESVSMFTCKFFVFMQYFSLQCSGMLHSLVSVDRYFTVINKPGSWVNRLPFGTTKKATILSVSVCLFLMILNGHLLIFNGIYTYKTANQTLSNGSQISVQVQQLVCYESSAYQIVPMWDQVYMVFYNFVPFCIMTIFNTLLITKMLGLKKSQQHDKVTRKRNRMTISLITITFGFIFSTLPGTVSFGYFYAPLFAHAWGQAVLIITDSLLFLQHSSIFFVSLLTNYKFRNSVKSYCRAICHRNHAQSHIDESFTSIAAAARETHQAQENH